MPQIAYTTQKYPTTTTTPGGGGTLGTWANPTNIFLDDGLNATSSYLETPQQAPSINSATYNMNIPSTATIDGIVVEMEVPSSNRWATSNSPFSLNKGLSRLVSTGTVSGGVHTLGGAADLWGATWTPAEINSASFGTNFTAGLSSSPNDFSIAIDYIRITVYWHYEGAVAPADVPKRYLYKVFNDGNYLGNLPSVVSKFGYALDINSAGSSLNIECAISADTSSQQGSRIVTEAGEPITTEDNQYIYTDGQPPIIGLGNAIDPTMIQNGNRVEVWEYGYYHPNGKLVFKGQVNKIEAGFGNSSSNRIKLLVLSDGLDLDNYIARGAPFNYTNDVVQTSQNAFVTSSYSTGDKGGGWNVYGQTWIVGAGVTKLGAIKLLLRGTGSVRVDVHNGLNGSIIGTVTQSVSTGGAAVQVTFGFGNLIAVAPGNSYFFAVWGTPSIDVYYSTASPYANGQMYNSNYGGGSGGGGWYPVTGDLYFIAASGVGTTLATYTNQDPSTGMVKPIMDDYILRGGLIKYDTGTIEATGLSLTATFNTETILDAIKKALSLSPTGFYFYVDLGTNVLYFKQTPTTPTHTLIKGRHLNKISLTLSIENVTNQLLFSGAETAGTNLYTEYTDEVSRGNYGNRLTRKSDNRVSLQATADAIGQGFILENKDEYYETPVTIIDRTMDISKLRPGETVGLRGFGTFIDKLTLQIVRIEYQGESANLILGNLPKRFSNEFEKVIRGLIAEQTVANPSAPS